MRLPLAELELRRTGARKLTYAARVIVIAGMWPALMSLWLFTRSRGVTSSDDIMRFGSQIILSGVRSFQFLAVFVMGPLFTAGLIAEERRQGTLGMLMLADFRGRDILFAKFLSAFLTVELLVLSSLPVLAIASSLGGIDVPGMALQVFLLSCAAAAVCAIGLMCSARSDAPMEALFKTAVLIAVWYGATHLLDIARSGATVSAFNLGMAAGRVQAGTMAPGYWMPAVMIAGIITALALLDTIRRLPKEVEPSPEKHTTRRPRTGGRSLLDRWLPPSPEAQLIVSGASGLPFHAWSRRARWILALTLMPLVFLPCAGSLLVTALICYDVTSSVASARQSGAADTVLTTPVGDRVLARGLLNAFARRAILFLPALAAPGVMMLYYSLKYGGFLAMGEVHPIVFLVTAFVGLVLSPLVSLAAGVAVSCAATALPVSAPAQSAAAVFVCVSVTYGIHFGTRLAMMLVNTPMFTPVLYWIIHPALSAGVLAFIAFFAYRRFERHLARNWRTSPALQPVVTGLLPRAARGLGCSLA